MNYYFKEYGKKLFFILFISLLSANLYAGDVYDNGSVIDLNKTAKEKYDFAIKKWRSYNIKSYYLKIRYDTFSPISGIWELYIENNKTVKWIINGKVDPDDMKEAISGLNMDKLFRMAKASFQVKDEDAFIISVSYDDKLQYVKSLARIKNPRYDKNIRYDTTYKYEILDFKMMRGDR